MRLLESSASSFSRFTEGFTLPFVRRGLVLVDGLNYDNGDAFDSNGAGKSLLFEGAVVWPLFGKMSRYGNTRIGADEVCHARHDADVMVTFETSRGRFRVRRQRGPRGSPVVYVETEADGRYVPLPNIGTHATEATDDLTNLLGFDYQTLCSALFLQGSHLLGGVGYAQQMKALESALRFDIFTQAQKQAAERYRAAEDGLREVLTEMDRWLLVAEQARASIKDVESLDESERIEEIEGELDGLEPAVDCAKYWREQVSALDQAREFHSASVASMRTSLQDAEARIAEMTEAFKGRTKVACPTCERPVKDPKALLKLARQRAESVRLQLQGTEQALEQRRKELDEARKALRDCDEAIARTKVLSQELTLLRERQRKSAEILRRERAKLDEAKREMARLTQATADARHALQVARVWTRDKGFEELKAETLGAALPYLNQCADEYSSILTDGAIRVEFRTLRDSRSEPIFRLHGASAPTYEGCSAGERRRIDVILALSLRALARWRLGQPINVALWDEVFDPLDESGVRRAVQILERDITELESVFVITHSPHVKALFPGAQTLRVERSRGVSRVVE